MQKFIFKIDVKKTSRSANAKGERRRKWKEWGQTKRPAYLWRGAGRHSWWIIRIASRAAVPEVAALYVC